MESFYFLFFSPKKLVWLIKHKDVKPSPDSKMIELLTFENLFPPLRAKRAHYLVLRKSRPRSCPRLRI